MGSRCTYPDLILSSLAGEDVFVPHASQPQVGVPPTLVGRDVGVCSALCTMPQALPFFPSLLQKHLVAPVGVVEFEGQPVPGVGGWAQLR